LPLHTILIVGGSWVVLLILTIWTYRKKSEEDGE
jgi:hypothetical protein